MEGAREWGPGWRKGRTARARLNVSLLTSARPLPPASGRIHIQSHHYQVHHRGFPVPAQAVPFAFGDAQQLVLHDGELKPLQRAITDSGASELWAHSMRRYGPNGEGISVVPDSITRRVLVPMEEAVASQVEAEAAAYEAELAAAQSQGGAPVEGADDRSEGDGVLEIDEEDLDAMELPQLGFEELGQYCNDLAFSKDMIGEEHAVFEYEVQACSARGRVRGRVHAVATRRSMRANRLVIASPAMSHWVRPSP
eukprot:scaffold211119_cov30-Tisochrysis_lutea.AAC.2